MSFWQRWRSPDTKALFLEFNPREAQFISVTWNFDLKDPSHRQWTIEVTREVKDSIEWRKQKGHELVFFRGTNLVGRKKIQASFADDSALMNLALHSTLKLALESHQEFMLAPVSGATTQDFQSEQKSLLWIQASFGTVSRVLERMKGEKGLILTAAFFSGVTAETGEKVVRLIAFNLDILFYLRPDMSLQIVIFDDKNKGHGNAGAPTFQQTIKVTKPQFYDEIVKLTNQLALAGELK